MKKLIGILLISMVLTGCGVKNLLVKAEPLPNRFQMIEQSNGDWQVCFDRETGVMYVVSRAAHNRGTFTVLVDAEGKPLIYNMEGK